MRLKNILFCTLSGKQLDRMIMTEAGTYSITGCTAGIVLGIALQKLLVTKLLSSTHINWKFPLAQVVIIFVLALLITMISVISPLKKVKSRGISETIGSLQ
jgi:putative ABC transport system permease protein